MIDHQIDRLRANNLNQDHFSYDHAWGSCMTIIEPINEAMIVEQFDEWSFDVENWSIISDFDNRFIDITG